eukprot:5483056-Pleurochrysis_carterae.AAC.3
MLVGGGVSGVRAVLPFVSSKAPFCSPFGEVFDCPTASCGGCAEFRLVACFVPGFCVSWYDKVFSPCDGDAGIVSALCVDASGGGVVRMKSLLEALGGGAGGEGTARCFSGVRPGWQNEHPWHCRFGQC